MPPPAGWINPIVVSPGQGQAGVDATRLLPARMDLEQHRLAAQAALLKAGTPRHTPIQVTQNGVIYDGHHAVRAERLRNAACPSMFWWSTTRLRPRPTRSWTFRYTNYELSS